MVPKKLTLKFRVDILFLGVFDYADDESDGFTPIRPLVPHVPEGPHPVVSENSIFVIRHGKNSTLVLKYSQIPAEHNSEKISSK